MASALDRTSAHDAPVTSLQGTPDGQYLFSTGAWRFVSRCQGSKVTPGKRLFVGLNCPPIRQIYGFVERIWERAETFQGRLSARRLPSFHGQLGWRQQSACCTIDTTGGEEWAFTLCLATEAFLCPMRSLGKQGHVYQESNTFQHKGMTMFEESW